MRSIVHAADGIVRRDDGQRVARLIVLVGLDGRYRSYRLGQESADGAIVVVRRTRRRAIGGPRLMTAGVIVMLAGCRFASRRVMRVIVQQAARGGSRHIGSQREQRGQRMFS